VVGFFFVLFLWFRRCLVVFGVFLFGFWVVLCGRYGCVLWVCNEGLFLVFFVVGGLVCWVYGGGVRNGGIFRFFCLVFFYVSEGFID